MSLVSTIVFPQLGDKNQGSKSNFISNLLLIIGFLGINSGSQLSFGTMIDAVEVSQISLYTLISAFGSISAGLITGKFTPLPGLISSSAEAVEGSNIEYFVFGFCSSLLYHYANIFCISSLKIANGKDLGIISSAIFGSLVAAPILPQSRDTPVDIKKQLIGVVSYIAFFAITSFIVLMIIKKFNIKL